MTEEKILSIVQRVLNGDANAFEDIVREYERNVYNIALRMSGDREDALDISQESFLKAYHSLANFRGESKFSVWLYRIVSNTCLDFLRERKRRAEVSLVREADEGEGEETQIPDESLSPETLLDRKLTRIPYFWCRIFTDGLCALVCWLSGGIIGIGTLVTAFGFGPVIAFFNRLVAPFYTEKQHE